MEQKSANKYFPTVGDGGATWSEAQLGASASRYAWSSWTFAWDAARGEYVLQVRASDADGNVQPAVQQWNFSGYGNNGVQRVNVVVK